MISVSLVNTNMSEGKEIEVDFGTAAVYVDAECLVGDAPTAYNSFEQPDRVRRKKVDTPEGSSSVFKLALL